MCAATGPIFISGHPKQTLDGKIAGPFGKVGTDLTTENAQTAAHDIAVSVMANLKAQIGELSRVAGWLRVFGMVNSAPAMISSIWSSMVSVT